MHIKRAVFFPADMGVANTVYPKWRLVKLMMLESERSYVLCKVLREITLGICKSSADGVLHQVVIAGQA